LARKRPPPTRAKVDVQLAVEIVATHKRSRSMYGSPRVHAELHAKGVRVSEKRVARLMRQNGLRARQKRRFRRTTESFFATLKAEHLEHERYPTRAAAILSIGDYNRQLLQPSTPALAPRLHQPDRV
jgi:transposase InsO family protein